MRRLIGATLMSILLLSAVVNGVVIEQIDVSYSTGGTAQYTAGTGALDWSGGNFTYIFTDTGGAYLFEKTVFDFEWSLYSDDTGGGNPKARFDLVSPWTITLYDNEYDGAVAPVVQLTGSMYTGLNNPFNGRYLEEKTGTRTLDGKAWSNIDSVWADPDWVIWAIGPNTVIEWDNDDVAGLDSDVTLDPLGPDIDYASNYSAPDGLTVTFFADQSQVIPEPVTAVLLGLGAIILHSRRRRAVG